MLQFKRVTTTAAVILTVALPATAAAQGAARQDLRSPDQREPVAHQAAAQDLRSPDRREPVAGGQVSAIRTVPVQRPASAAGDGFDWSDAVIGAAGGLAIISIAGGVAMALTHRRRSARVIA